VALVLALNAASDGMAKCVFQLNRCESPVSGTAMVACSNIASGFSETGKKIANRPESLADEAQSATLSGFAAARKFHREGPALWDAVFVWIDRVLGWVFSRKTEF
jgi:hypothetical protein